MMRAVEWNLGSLYCEVDGELFRKIFVESTMLERDFGADVNKALKCRFDEYFAGPSVEIEEFKTELRAEREARLGILASVFTTERGRVLFQEVMPIVDHYIPPTEEIWD